MYYTSTWTFALNTLCITVKSIHNKFSNTYIDTWRSMWIF